MSFKEKIMGGNKIKNVSIISEAKLRLTSQFSNKVYVQNTPPKSSFNDDGMGHRQNTFFLAAPERYRNSNRPNYRTGNDIVTL